MVNADHDKGVGLALTSHPDITSSQRVVPRMKEGDDRARRFPRLDSDRGDWAF
jgi:hypothetical protein